MDRREPTFRNFIASFRNHLGDAMSGGFSIPFYGIGTALAFFSKDNTAALVGAMLFFALAFCGGWYAAFRIWASERTARNAAEDAAKPRLKLLGVKERRTSKIDGNIDQEFTLNIENTGLGALSNCLVKVLSFESGDPNMTPTALRTYNQPNGQSSAFNMRGHETKEIFLCWNTVSPGDTFISTMVLYEQGAEGHMIDKGCPAKMRLGLYSEVAPTYVTINFVRNDKSLLEIDEIP